MKTEIMEQWFSLPRGIRNNNPGNIRRAKGQKWMGELTQEEVLKRGWKWDASFVQFDDMVYGLRALWVTLNTYFTKHKLRTIEQIITRWAPPADGNKTEDYIKFVCNITEKERDYCYPHAPSENHVGWILDVYAICRRECGYQPNYERIKLAWTLAFLPKSVVTFFRDKDGKITAYTEKITL